MILAEYLQDRQLEEMGEATQWIEVIEASGNSEVTDFIL